MSTPCTIARRTGPRSATSTASRCSCTEATTLLRVSRLRVDLRSDTVTTPTAEMRAAMADAEVGDAWYGDDPTANHLQELAADRLGKQAAVYVPTGTMANQIALALQVRTRGHLVA